MVDEGRSKLTQPTEAQCWIAKNEGGSVLVRIFGSSRDDCKGVICRCYAGCLNVSAEHIIDKGGFSRAVISEKQDKREQCIVANQSGFVCAFSWCLLLFQRSTEL